MTFSYPPACKACSSSSGQNWQCRDLVAVLPLRGDLSRTAARPPDAAVMPPSVKADARVFGGALRFERRLKTRAHDVHSALVG
jgi:hypothetical protein